MQKPSFPADEARRLEALRGLKVLDTAPEERFDRLTRLAQTLLGAPTALVSLSDAERQWFKSRQGLDLKEIPRAASFCGHAILGAEPFVVADALKDPRFADNPLVTGAPNIRSYAGAPLRLSSGEAMGTLCVLDRIPRVFDARRLQLLRDLALLASNELEGASLDVAVRAAREAEARYRALLDDTTDLILDVDAAGRVLRANQALRAKLDAAGKSLDDLAAPGSRAAFAGSGPIEAALRTASGERLLVEGRAFPVDGGTRWILRDVTAAARMERRLAGRLAASKARRRRSDEAARELRAAVDGSALVSETDADGRITAVNALFTELSGWTLAEALGKTHRIVKSGVHPDEFFRRLWTTISSGKAWRGEICDRAKNGSLYWVSATITPCLDAEGKPSRYLSIAHDVTGRKLAEAAAADAEARLRTILDSAAQVSIIAADAGGLITAFNKGAENLLGWSASEMLGKPYALVQPGGDEAYARKDGSAFPAALTKTVLRGRQGEPAGFLAVAVDATQSRVAREELARARDAAVRLAEAKSHFLASMTRELRAPMNAVVANSGRLLEAGLPAEQRELAEAVRGAGEALQAMLGDLLDFAKLEAGAAALEEHDFDPRLVAEDAAMLFAGPAQDKGLELAAAVEEGVPPRLRGDAGRLRQVVAGFVSNALKFTEAGEIVVGVRRLGEEGRSTRLRFEVKDTGPGLDEAAQAGLFAYDGRGVGLPAAKKLAALMNGSVGATSAPGKGSTFWLEVPLAKAASAPEAEAPGFPGVRLLIVDGSETGRRVAALRAAALRMRPHAAADGAAALAALRAAEAEGDPFILALIDMRLPDMDGAQLSQEIKGDPALVAVRMILMSALSARPDPEQLPALGFDGSLAKPLLGPAFLAGVGSALGKTPAAAPLASCRGLRVLVAEDNVVSRKAVLLHLQALGCRADAVADGREAAAATAVSPYDLLLMDCRMPEMDGPEAAAAIRARPVLGGRRLAIIAMIDEDGDRERCLAAGMDDCVFKPVRLEDLAAVCNGRHRPLDPEKAQP